MNYSDNYCSKEESSVDYVSCESDDEAESNVLFSFNRNRKIEEKHNGLLKQKNFNKNKYIELRNNENVSSLSGKCPTIKLITDPSIVFHHRNKVEKICEHNVYLILEEINKRKKLLTERKGDRIIEEQISNLILQQSHYEKAASDAKMKLSVLTLSNRDVVKTCADVLDNFIKESQLFSVFYPAYGYQSDILRSISNNQVNFVIANKVCGFDTVLPFALKKTFPKNLIIVCENQPFSKISLFKHLQNFMKKSDLKTVLNENVTNDLVITTIEELVNFISNQEKFFSFPFILLVQISLKRGLLMDILLAQCQNMCTNNKNFKLVVFLSSHDCLSDFSNMFHSKTTVQFFLTPKLLHQVRLVWKAKDLTPKDDFIIDVVKTVLAIHEIEQTSGDILVFMPSLCTAQKAASTLVKKCEEMHCYDLKCSILDEFKLHSRELGNHKRDVFFVTTFAEDLHISSVSFVIDCGLQEQLIYDSKKKIDVLRTSLISCEQAKLRKSLAGDFCSGTCFRMYSRNNYRTMLPKTYPEIALRNPVNTILKCFYFKVYNTMEANLIKILSGDVIKNVLHNLKNAGAVKNNQLTFVGNRLNLLPFKLKYSELIYMGFKRGYLYEMIVLVAFLASDDSIFITSAHERVQQALDANKMHLIQYESDTLTYLHVFKLYSESICPSSWCKENYFNNATFQKISLDIANMCDIVNKAFGITLQQTLAEIESCYTELKEILFDCYTDNLSVYTGHFKSGYRILSASSFVHIDEISFICQKQNLPHLIIFDCISTRHQNTASHITSVPDDLIMKKLGDGTLSFSFNSIYEQTLSERVVGPIGEKIMREKFSEKCITQLENQIKHETGDNLVILEPSVEDSCIHIFALLDTVNYAFCAVSDLVNSQLEIILQEEQQEVVTLKKGKNEIYIEMKCTNGVLTKSLAPNLQNNIVKTKDCSDLDKTGYAVVVDDRKNHPYYLCVSWTRRPCTGDGLVSFSTSQDFIFARNKLALKSLKMLQKDVFFQVNNKTEELQLTGLPPEANSQTFIKEFSQLFPNLRIRSVELSHRQPYTISQEDIYTMKSEIDIQFKKISSLAECKVNIVTPKPSDLYMSVYFYAYNLDSLAIANEIFFMVLKEDKKFVTGILYNAIIECDVSIFNVLKVRLINELTVSDQNEGSKLSFTFLPDLEDPGIILIQLSANKSQVLYFYQQRVKDMLLGEILVESNANEFDDIFSGYGQRFLKSLEILENVRILDDHRRKILRLYGSLKACKQIKCEIKQFLNDAENDIIHTMHLSNPSIKVLIKEYGIHLKGLIESCSLRSAFLDIKKRQILLRGSQDKINKAESFLREFFDSHDLETTILDASQEICPICLCPTQGLTYRLEHCGHLYCSDCIKSFIEQAQFPLQCCVEKCSKDLILEDVRKILKNEPDRMSILLEKSMKEYLQRNHLDIHLCPAPDCPMFFFRNEQLGNKVTCGLCKNNICLSCNVIYHEGYSCDMYQNSKKDPDYSFKVWQKTQAGCKLCPHCHTAIEKVLGCNRMYCISCRKSFCWLCLSKFTTDDEVYRHIALKHPGMLYM